MERKQSLKVVDKWEFPYTVSVVHIPQHGISTAYFDDDIIAQREYGCIYPPTGDSDKDWETFEELFSEWSDAALVDLEPECIAYFNSKP